MEICRKQIQIRSAFDNRRKNFSHILALKGCLTRQHLIQHTAKCPNVGSLIDRLSPCLLRRHICRRAENHSLLRGHVAQRGRVRQIQFGLFPGKRLRQAEIQHLHFAVRRDLDVRRL